MTEATGETAATLAAHRTRLWHGDSPHPQRNHPLTRRVAPPIALSQRFPTLGRFG
jgi:hypothetical protein